MYFFGIFLLFLITKFVFLSFSFLSSIKFPQQNINQSETWIGGFQQSAELYANDTFTMKNQQNSSLMFFIVAKRRIFQKFLFHKVGFRCHNYMVYLFLFENFETFLPLSFKF